MKKFFFLGALFAVGLGFTACSSDKDEVANGNSSGVDDGLAYVSLAINLPSDNSGITRGENDVYSDGKADEYTVNDVTLLFFEGTATSSKLLGKYQPTPSWNRIGTSIDNITSVANIVQAIDKKLSNTPMHLLVILNDASGITYSTTTGSETTLGDVINATVTSSNAITAGKMMMVNAPLAKAPGANTEPTTDLLTLVPIATTQIYNTAEDAKANPAAQVYVERLASKVTVHSASGNTTNGTLPYSLVGWAIDNYNTKSYLMRSTNNFSTFNNYYSDKVAATKKWRMVGSTAVGQNYDASETYYRTYWAEDINYGNLTEALTTTTTPTYKTSFGDDNPAYCFENTFSVANQLFENTTRVVFKVQFNGGSPFYTIGGNGSVLYASDAALITKLKELLLNLTSVQDWLTLNATALGGNTFDGNDVTITISTSGTTTTVTDITFSLTDFNTSDSKYVAPDTYYSGWITDLNAAADGITKYDGNAYYVARIKHFGDELTPWLNTDHLTTGAYEDEDGAGKPISRYLGRYGMLRNNWYDLTISTIKQIGSATVPTVTGDTTTDDVVESYIAVKINVLSWAKRTQTVNL